MALLEWRLGDRVVPLGFKADWVASRWGQDDTAKTAMEACLNSHQHNMAFLLLPTGEVSTMTRVHGRLRRNLLTADHHDAKDAHRMFKATQEAASC